MANRFKHDSMVYGHPGGTLVAGVPAARPYIVPTLIHFSIGTFG
jgi:hypothetical protein